MAERYETFLRRGDELVYVSTCESVYDKSMTLGGAR